MEYNYFDVHSHLTEKRFSENRDNIAQEMLQKSIGTISIGVDQKESLAAVGFAQKHENIFASIGQHPADNKEEIFDVNFYQKLYDENKDKVVCVGECGLDYYWNSKELKDGKISEIDFSSDKRRQVDLFEQQIDFAVANDLPLMLHVRSFENADAHKDAFDILDTKQQEHHGKVRADFHFFTETPEIAEQIIGRGFYISFPGVITFADLDKTIKVVPLDRMFSETDSPYAAPKPFRGQDATPLMVPEMVRKIAQVKNLDQEIVRIQLLKNTKEFFRI